MGIRTWAYACTYVCMHACMHACMYGWRSWAIRTWGICGRMHVCMLLDGAHGLYGHGHMQIVCMCACVYACGRMCVCMCACVYACAHVCMHVDACVHACGRMCVCVDACVHIGVDACVHVRMCVCMCVCMDAPMRRWWRCATCRGGEVPRWAMEGPMHMCMHEWTYAYICI